MWTATHSQSTSKLRMRRFLCCWYDDQVWFIDANSAASPIVLNATEPFIHVFRYLFGERVDGTAYVIFGIVTNGYKRSFPGSLQRVPVSTSDVYVPVNHTADWLQCFAFTLCPLLQASPKRKTNKNQTCSTVVLPEINVNVFRKKEQFLTYFRILSS